MGWELSLGSLLNQNKELYQGFKGFPVWTVTVETQNSAFLQAYAWSFASRYLENRTL